MVFFAMGEFVVCVSLCFFISLSLSLKKKQQHQLSPVIFFSLPLSASLSLSLSSILSLSLSSILSLPSRRAAAPFRPLFLSHIYLSSLPGLAASRNANSGLALSDPGSATLPRQHASILSSSDTPGAAEW